MNFYNDPIVSVEDLIATVYHRVAMLYPYMEFMGYGYGRVGSGGVDVIDFGHGTTATSRQQVIVFPAIDQTNVPTWWIGLETPSPLPPDAPLQAVGYPITIQPIAYVPFTVTQAELHDGHGQLVEVYPNPPDCGCYALIPISPLQQVTTYTVHVTGTVDGIPFEKTWTFITEH